MPWQEWLYHGNNGTFNPRWGINLPAPYLVCHHTPAIDPQSYDEAVEALNGVWYYHTFVAEGGWGWIGYNTIGWGRYIFEGAGLGNRGIHAPGGNGISHGHAFLLDGRVRQPTQEEWSALRALMADAISWGYLNHSIIVPGSGHLTFHRDWISTACPEAGVLDSYQRFYNTSPNPNPDPHPNPDRRKGGENIMFKPRVDSNGNQIIWPAGSFGFQWPCKAYDAPVPAGYKIGVTPTQQHHSEITVVTIINGQQQQPASAAIGRAHFQPIMEDAFVTILVAADVEPNISVG